MFDILRTTRPIARKVHFCELCGGKIEKGERYYVQVNTSDGIHNWKDHISCHQLTIELDMYDDRVDGLTSEGFWESVHEAFKEITNNTDHSAGNAEQIEAVKNYFLK